MAGYDFGQYLDWDLEKLLEQLASVQSTIANAFDQLGEARSRELDEQAAGWAHSGETTVRAREKSSSFASVAATQTKYEMLAIIDAAREERDFLITLIGVRRG
jgi:hypothetical protein